MSKEVEMSPGIVAAYTVGRTITIPDYHPPVQFATHLGHELGHVLKNHRKFRRQNILTPAEIFETTLDLSSPCKRWYAELFLTNEAGTGGWHSEVIDLVYKTLALIAKKRFDPFDPMAVELQLLTDRNKFLENTASIDFAASGILAKNDKQIAVATSLGHSSEVPAYYTQFGVGIILENTLTEDEFNPVGVCIGEPRLPSHLAAYQTVERLVEKDSFPTSKIIHQEWQDRLKSA